MTKHKLITLSELIKDLQKLEEDYKNSAVFVEANGLKILKSIKIDDFGDVILGE